MTMAKEYDVGYGKPPNHSKFKPGQSGNPSGRRKRGFYDFGEDDFAEELLKPVTVIGSGGRKKKVHPLHLIAQRVVKEAAAGNFKAIKLYQQLTGFLFETKSALAHRRLNNDRLLEQFRKDGEEFLEVEKKRQSTNPAAQRATHSSGRRT